MLPTTREMLDISIAQLETLAAFLGEQLGEGNDCPRHITEETRACNEILGSLRELIVRVRPRSGAEPGSTAGAFLLIGYRQQSACCKSHSHRAELAAFSPKSQEVAGLLRDSVVLN